MPYLGASGDIPGANIKTYRYKQGTDTSSSTTSFPAVNKGADELRVYLNGSLLKLTADYTFTTSAVSITPAPADDDEIQIDVYTSMNLADTVSSSDGGNFVSAVTFQSGVKTGAVKAQDGTSAITIADSTGKVTIPGDLEIQGTTTTIDTAVESVDKLEVGANSGDHAVKVNQTGTGNLLQLQDSGTDKFVVKDGGNVGIGLSPSSTTADGDTLKGLSIGQNTANGEFSYLQLLNRVENATTSNYIHVDFDHKVSGSTTIPLARISARPVSATAGELSFSTSSSSSLSPAITIDSAGNVGIGTTSAGTATGFDSPCFEVAGSDPSIVLSKTGADSIAIVNHSSYLKFINDTDDRAFFLLHQDAPANSLVLDSNGNIGIGAQTANVGSNSNTGLSIGNDGWFTESRDDGALQYLNRNTSDGKIVIFYKNETEVGSISTNTSAVPSDRNFKRDIEDIDLGLNLINKLLPKQFLYKVSDDDSPKMYGLIAQELEESLTECGIEKNSIALLQHRPNEKETESDYDVDYSKLIPVLINAVKELSAKVTALEGS